MKYLFVLAVAVGAFDLMAAAQAEEKKVCEKVTDAKTKKQKEVCKTIKIHKKLDVK